MAGCRDRSEHREPHAGPTAFNVSTEYLHHIDLNAETA
jgi:hypothetical protein